MGNLQATEFAEAVATGEVALEAALSWHLTSNHYPPVPVAMVPICVAAIRAAETGDAYQDIDLPAGATWRGQQHAPVWAIVEGYHLDSFIEISEED